MMICRHNWMEVFHYGGIYNKVIGDPEIDENWGKLEVRSINSFTAELCVEYEEDTICGRFVMTIEAKNERDLYRVDTRGIGGWPLALLKPLTHHQDPANDNVYYLTEMNLNKFIKRWEVILGFLKR